ncbi:hypothetical protein MRB53_014470 [Persea americana]|uniref:Uncharacterized protein n=1 Tax=Persea americana TaxID=3435 RepID=A0ACC2KBE0_PERAE|nr:hypothetical protein MRB53_014470 [Persea americana]
MADSTGSHSPGPTSSAFIQARSKTSFNEGICGNHIGGRSLAYRGISQGYWWPYMQKDAQFYARKSEKWQKFLHSLHQPATTPRRSTSATPFSLAYGMEAVIPLEVGLPTLRSELCDQGLNDLNVARELDFAEERREVAAIRLAAYQQQLARGYNQKVKERGFAVG